MRYLDWPYFTLRKRKMWIAPRTRLKSLHRLVDLMISVCWDTIQKVAPSQWTPETDTVLLCFFFFFCTLLQWWMLILNRVKVSNSFSTVHSVWCQRQRLSLAAHNWLWRLTDDPEDPLFEDTCEEHENGKPGSQHTDLQKEKPYVYQKHKQNNKTHAYDMPNTDAVALLILLDTML